MSINFISSNGSDETCNMRTKSNYIEIMMDSGIDEIIDALFESFAKISRRIRRINEKRK